MTDNLTYDDSSIESHYSKTCEASSYKEELSATSKPDSQINTTEELSACLARLQSVEDLTTERTTSALLARDALRAVNYPDAIALANKLQAENERLKALLVECRDALQCPIKSQQMYDKLHAAGIGEQ